MSRIVCFITACVVLGPVGTGCQSVADYPVDRARDFSDVFGVDFYWGQGLLANARATKLVQAGIGKFDGCVASYDKRAAGVKEEMRAEAGVPLYYFTVYDRKATETGNERFKNRLAAETDHGVVKYNLTDPQDRSYYQIGFDIAAFAGVGIDLDLFQFLDLTLGLFGLDIARDDQRHEDVPDVDGPRYEEISDLPVTKA